jgi:hypothetical protein
MNPLNSAKYFTQPEAELIELAPGLKVTQDFIDSYPERELPHFVQGYIDILEGRVFSHEEVLKILADDAKQYCLESERAKSI